MAVVVVRPPAGGDLRATLDVLVDALADDPGWAAVLPDARHRRTALRCVVAVALADSGRHVRAAFLDGRVVGAAVWQPPGRYPMSGWRQVRAVPRMLPLVRLGRRARDVQQFGAAIDAAFPSMPVRYLQALGVAPDAQGRGVGSRLLADGLAEADMAVESVYLETGKADNVAYYERYGFALTPPPGGPLYDGGPPMWLMTRPASG